LVATKVFLHTTVTQENFCIDSKLKHCLANRKIRLSALPNVRPYIYDVKISGFTRSYIYIYIYDISRLRVKSTPKQVFVRWFGRVRHDLLGRKPTPPSPLKQSTHNLQPANSYNCTQLTPKTASVVPPEDGRLTPETCRGLRHYKVIVKVKVY
jgi:hypothetical protein